LSFSYLRASGTIDEDSSRSGQSSSLVAYDWDPVTDIVIIPEEHILASGIPGFTNITAREMLSKVHPDDQERILSELAEFAPASPFIQTSFRAILPGRGVIRVELSGRALFDDAGRIIRVIGIAADMSANQLAEMELARANERLHLAMDAGITVGWDWDLRSGADSWFGDLQTIFGIPGNHYIGHVEDFRRRVHPDDRALVWQAVKEAMEGRTPYVAEFRVIRNDGAVRWLAAQGKFYYSSSGEPERMMGIAVDTTARKATEAALRQKDFELAQAQRLAQVGSWQWDPETDTVDWSDELYNIAGRDGRLPAPTFAEHSQLYTAESWEQLRAAVEKALRSGTPYELVLEMVRPDGSTRWLIGRGETQSDPTGRIVRLFGTVQDITERRQAQEALRESEERLRLAAQAGRMYAFEWDRQSDMIVRSAEFAPILGLVENRTDTTCQQMLTSVHPEDRDQVIAATNGCTPESPYCQVRYRVIRPDGSVVWLEKNARAFFDEKGTILRMIGMVVDITERKLGEEAISSMSRRLIKAQEEERARIARELHDDISQRLAMLSVSLERTKRIVPESENALRSHMDELRQQVLDISTGIHALSHELHSSKLRQMDMVNAMRGFCMELSEQQRVEIHFGHKDIPVTMPLEISICLFRVLQEALHNALKHSGVRQFEVVVQGAAGAVNLIIRDSGLGFEPEVAMKGQGLGLTSMKERLKLVHGELSVDSQPGRGATIRASVPFTRSVRTAVATLQR